MLIVKILGLLDITTALLLWLSMFHIIPSSLLMLFAFFLLAKGLIFMIPVDITSILDIICSIIIFIAINTNMPKFIVIIASLFLIEKGIVSFFA